MTSCPICELTSSPEPVCLCGYDHITGDTTHVIDRARAARRSAVRGMTRGAVTMVAIPLAVVVIPVIPIAAILLPLSLFGGVDVVRGFRRFREARRRLRHMLPSARVIR